MIELGHWTKPNQETNKKIKNADGDILEKHQRSYYYDFMKRDF